MVGKKTMDYYKAAFDNMFNFFRMLQVQNENTFDMVLRQVPWITDTSRQFFMDWIFEIHKVENVMIDLNQQFVHGCFNQTKSGFIV